MSAFQIQLQDLRGQSVKRELQPAPKTLNALFEELGPDFRLTNPQAFRAQIRAQMADDTVHVTGQAQAEFAYRCGRCLGEKTLEINTDIDFVLMSETQWSTAYEGDEEIALNEQDLDVSYYSGDYVDIGELIRQAIVLELPAFPHCPVAESEQCEERSQQRIGTKILEELEDNKIDLRWSALKELKISDDGEIQKVERDKN